MADLIKEVVRLSEDFDTHVAGTESEYHVATKLERAMRDRGLQTNVQEFVAPSLGSAIFGILAVVTALVAILSGLNTLLAAICLIVAIAALVLWVGERQGKAWLTSMVGGPHSQNVVARHPSSGPIRGRTPRPVVIVAHYDNPKVDYLYNPVVANYRPFISKIINILMLTAPVLILLQTIAVLPAGFRTFLWVVTILAVLPLLVFGILRILSHYVLPASPGANDNSSGVAVLHGIADRLCATGTYPVHHDDEEDADKDEDGPNYEDYLLGRRSDEETAHAEDEEIRAQDLRESLAVESVSRVRRGAGVAKALGIFPATVEIVYDSAPESAPVAAPVTKPTPEPKKPVEEKAIKEDVKPAQDEEKSKAAEKVVSEDTKTEEKDVAAAVASVPQAPASPVGAKAPAPESVRSRFADLPVDFQRDRSEEKEEEPLIDEDSEQEEIGVAEDASQAEENASEDLASSEAEPEIEPLSEAQASDVIEEAEKLEDDAADAPVDDDVQDSPDTTLSMQSTSPIRLRDDKKKSAQVFDLDDFEESVSEPMPVDPKDGKTHTSVQLVTLEEERAFRRGDTFEQLGSTQEMKSIDKEKASKHPSLTDPNWGRSEYRPTEHLTLLDLPDPSVSAVNPFSVSDISTVGDFNPEDFPADEFDDGAYEAKDRTRTREREMPKREEVEREVTRDREADATEGPLQRLGSKLNAFFNRSAGEESQQPRRSSRDEKRSRKGGDEESMSDWLDLEDDYNAKSSGREIGSWDRFEEGESNSPDKTVVSKRKPSDDDWQGGAVKLDNDGDDDELRDKVLQLCDRELSAHEVWLVALGSGELGNAGMKAFLREYKKELRGAFIINVKAVGAGDFYVAKREGDVFTRNGDRRLMNLIRRAGEQMDTKVSTTDLSWTDTDATPALREGYRAVTLMGLRNGVPVNSHQPNDTPQNVKASNLSKAVEIIVEAIRRS